MRAREFITEQKLDDVHDGLDVVSRTLPHTYVIPELENQDFYDLYRFGLAIAAVRGEANDDKVRGIHEPKFRAKSTWNEKQVVSSFDPEVDKLIDKALSKIGKKGKVRVSTPTSDEMEDTYKISPMKAFKGYTK